MNSNLFQTILTVLATVATGATALLTSLGCTELVSGLSCNAAHAPAWLIPYLSVTAVGLGVLKLVLKAFGGTLK